MRPSAVVSTIEVITPLLPNMVRVERTFSPRMENARVYDRLYNEVYKKMYPVLSPLHSTIAEITGYPKVK